MPAPAVTTRPTNGMRAGLRGHGNQLGGLSAGVFSASGRDARLLCAVCAREVRRR